MRLFQIYVRTKTYERNCRGLNEKAVVFIDLICSSTLILRHISIDYIFNFVITIAYGDRGGHCRGRLLRQQWHALSRLGRQLLRREITTSYQSLCVRGFQAPTKARVTRIFKVNRLCAVHTAEMASVHDLKRHVS